MNRVKNVPAGTMKNPAKMAYSHSRVVLAGMMGSGKSTIAKLLASYLNWELIDTDEWIESHTGKSIRDIFEQDGEEYFRDLEAQVVHQLFTKKNCVIATGGGMVISDENRRLLAKDSLFVHLFSSVDELMNRLNKVTDRPLLIRGNLHQELQTIYQSRSIIYEELPVQILTDEKSPIQVVQEILFYLISSHEIISTSEYQVHVGYNLISQLALILHNGNFSVPVFVLADEQLWKLSGQFYMEQVKEVLGKEFNVVPILLPSSEQSKSIQTAIFLWKKLISKKADRSSCLIVMGGGVLGDVGGFVASTLFRGIAYIQIPTTLLAQIDSAIGGKTGVNLKNTKNMVGTFYPAAFTFVDPLLLLTLPERDFRNGMAEMIKVALLGDENFFAFLEAKIESILAGKLEPLLEAIVRSAKIKVDIVEEDRFEKSGRRIVLNLGHTYGHAVEVASHYELRHGEAVAIGMVLATKLANRLHYCDLSVLDRLLALLKRSQLPTESPIFSENELLAIMKRDKKWAKKVLNFVFPRQIGKAEAIALQSEQQLLLAFD